MKTSQYILFILITLIAFSSCTEIVEIDLEEAGDPKLVVFGEITNEPGQQAVYLSLSTPYFYNEETPPVTDANVSISDETGTVILTEDLGNPGTYLTPEDYAGVPGRTYQLLIENVDANNDGLNETYMAETTMKSVSPVEDVNVVYNSRWGGWEVRLFANEPGETTDFYMFKVYKNDTLYTDTISNYWTTDDRFFNGSLINGPIVQFFDEEKGEIVHAGDTITLEMAGITEEYFDFINSVIEEVSEKVPIFSGPSANVPGNISNGALGFFSVISVTRNTTIYEGE